MLLINIQGSSIGDNIEETIGLYDIIVNWQLTNQFTVLFCTGCYSSIFIFTPLSSQNPHYSVIQFRGASIRVVQTILDQSIVTVCTCAEFFAPGLAHESLSVTAKCEGKLIGLLLTHPIVEREARLPYGRDRQLT